MEEKQCPLCSGKTKIRTAEEKKALVSRVNRIAGQMNGVARMIEEDRYCDDVLTQLSAIEHSVKSLAGAILDSHLHTCVVEKIQSGDTQVVDELIEIFRRFV